MAITGAQLVQSLRAGAAAIAGADLITPVSRAMLAEQLDQTFVQGLNSDNSKIGQYSTRPASFGRMAYVVQSAYKKPFLNGGYAELRRINGRQANYIDLDYTSDLRSAMRMLPIPQGAAFVMIDSGQSKKLRSIVRRFPNALQAGPQVVDAGRKALEAEVLFILRKFAL